VKTVAAGRGQSTVLATAAATTKIDTKLAHLERAVS